MSLFASLGQGEIWSLSGITFASPINDLLDGGIYTLEDLLKEDELIQEVKAKNDRLLDFLCAEESMSLLLFYIITPAQKTDSDERRFKYPYMSCEVLCCEIPEIVHYLVEWQEGLFLNRLLSFLDQPDDLDCHLAGYFEKILEMLFRKQTSEMMAFFNYRGHELFRAFLRHINNYSVMQIVQRLLLPHLPFSSPGECADSAGNLSGSLNDDDATTVIQCNWSFLPTTCEMLLNNMLNPDSADEPLHISDMIITVLQLSPPETTLIKFLCQTSSIEVLFNAAVSNSNTDGNHSQNVSVAAASVLESLISRQYESGFQVYSSNGSQEGSVDDSHVRSSQEQIICICDYLAPVIFNLAARLQECLASANNFLVFQNKAKAPRLGHHGLLLVKLVESLSRIGNLNIDSALSETGTFQTCLQLMFHFEQNSVLHLSVQRIFVSIMESPIDRLTTQLHICKTCGLLVSIMQRLGEFVDDTSISGGGCMPRDCYKFLNPSLSSEDNAVFSFDPRHGSIVGNMIIIAHAACILFSGRDPLEDDDEDSEEVIAEDLTNAHTDNSGDAVVGLSLLERKQREIRRQELHSRAVRIRETLAREVDGEALLERWDKFIDSRLKQVLEHQMVGSYEAPPPTIPGFKDDNFNLGVDFDDDIPGKDYSAENNDPSIGSVHVGYNHNFYRGEDEVDSDDEERTEENKDLYEELDIDFSTATFAWPSYSPQAFAAQQVPPQLVRGDSDSEQEFEDPFESSGPSKASEDFADFDNFGEFPGESQSELLITSTRDVLDPNSTSDEYDF